MKENIVFLFADQLRPDFLSCYGADFIETPNIDEIAKSGVLYKNAYSTSPTCVPARASLLTGRNSISNGVIGNSDWLHENISDYGINTWPEILNEQGYFTAAIGKMHFYPWDNHMGFKYRVICEDKRWINVRDDYYKFLRENGYKKLHGNDQEGYHEGKGAMISPIPWELSVDHFVGMESCEFIETYGNDGSFAMMIGFPGPHGPYDPTEKFLDNINEDDMPEPLPNMPHTEKFRESNVRGSKKAWNGIDYAEFTIKQKKKIRAHYTALVKQIDYEVGQIILSLKENDLYANTTIIFASDHGDYLGDHGIMGKGHFLEGSCHIPLIVSRAQNRQHVECDSLVKLMDVTATLLSIADTGIPKYMDALPLPNLGIKTTEQKEIYGMNSSGWMVYDGEFIP